MPAAAKIFRRVWQLYVAYVFTFVLYTALVTYALSTVGNRGFVEEMKASGFVADALKRSGQVAQVAPPAAPPAK